MYFIYRAERIHHDCFCVQWAFLDTFTSCCFPCYSCSFHEDNVWKAAYNKNNVMVVMVKDRKHTAFWTSLIYPLYTHTHTLVNVLFQSYDHKCFLSPVLHGSLLICFSDNLLIIKSCLRQSQVLLSPCIRVSWLCLIALIPCFRGSAYPVL